MLPPAEIEQNSNTPSNGGQSSPVRPKIVSVSTTQVSLHDDLDTHISFLPQ